MSAIIVSPQGHDFAFRGEYMEVVEVQVDLRGRAGAPNRALG